MSHKIKTFSAEIRKQLKHYVYLLTDPATKTIFYVGEGVDNRVFSHVKPNVDNDKTKIIRNLLKQGIEPTIEILSHGLKKEEAIKIECAVIDLIGINNLTNEKKGYHAKSHGRMSIEQIVSKYRPKEAKIIEPSVLIKMQKTFRYDMDTMELYDFTRGIWRISEEKQKKIRYAFSVYDNVIQEVYEVKGWFEAGETLSVRKGKWNRTGRYEFVGQIAKKEIRNKYIYKSVNKHFPRGAANPIQYLNID